MIATLIIQELRSFFNTPFYWTLTTKAAKEYISCRYLFQLTASRRGWHLAGTGPETVHSFQLTASRRGWHNAACIYSYFYFISTHSLTKRLTSDHQEHSELVHISTHSLTKRLTTSSRISLISFSFQLTASRRGWLLNPLYNDIHNRNFNSQPHEEADGAFSWEDAGHLYFNSQPHEEADCGAAAYCGTEYISTHSLTKRLTTQQLTTKLATPISTHSLTKRLTGICHVILKAQEHFNSQPHEEADKL